MNRRVFSKLIRLHIITPGGIFNLLRSFVDEGITLMALMRFSAIYYPNRCALVLDEKRFSYKEIYENASRLAKLLYSVHGLKAGMCVGLMCGNHVMMTLLLPALSRLGVKVKLINTDITQCKLNDLVKRKNLELLICDSELKNERITNDLPCEIIESGDLYNEIIEKARNIDVAVPCIRRGSEISVFTGGSTGKSKEAARKITIGQFLPPFYALLDQLGLDEYDSVFLSLPVYHGFGLATLITSLLMGKKVCLMNHFDANKALKIIANEEIEVLPVVPAMLARLWQINDAPASMRSVKCIICGGDRLDKKWVDLTNDHLGNVLYNLFGTSEAGFFMIASPEELSRNEEVTIGKPIHGVKCRVDNPDSYGVGSLCVRSGWAMTGMRNKWQRTGDLVYCNSDGCYFYRGRADNMVVCGGENVYPENVEKIINSHDEVMTSIVSPESDPEFGTVLNAKVELCPNSLLTQEELKEWLRPRLTRAEMPHDITINTINVLETGKVARGQRL